MSSHPQPQRTSQRLAAKSTRTGSSLCGTNTIAKQRLPLLIQNTMLLDVCDSSSDDGDSLQTPISEPAHPVHIASVNASPAHAHEDGRVGRCATPSATHPARYHPKYFSDSDANNCDNESSASGFSYTASALPSLVLAGLRHGTPETQPLPQSFSSSSSKHSSLSFSPIASASLSDHSSGSGPSRSFASSTSSTDFHLCSSSSLLDSSLSFEESTSSSSDFSPSSVDASFSSTASAPLSILPGAITRNPMNPFSSSRFAPPPSSPLAQTFSAAQLDMRESHVEDTDSPTPTQALVSETRSSSQARKRLPDTQTPLPYARPGQKPKLSRSFASEFLPSTLGRSYSSRFPPDHRLRPDFVREYALDGELGKGGYGFVMAASHRRDGYEVAVKFITKAKIPSVSWSVDDCGRPVPKEARLLSQLDHPGIVKFLDLFEDDVYFYLVQEMHGSPWHRKKNAKFINGPQTSIDPEAPTDENRPPTPGHPQLTQLRSPSQNALGLQGMKLIIPTKFASTSSGNAGPARPSLAPRRASHDLFECIESTKNKRFSEEDAKYIFAQVVDVVIYLEKLGISHSDIKDENVVIDNDLRIKLIDFGSALVHETAQPLPFHRRFYGTSAFASPEIVTNQPWQASPAEVWALGMLLSYLMRGSSPFPTDADKLAGRVVLDERSRKRLSDDCVDLMRRCLRADPRERATIWEVREDRWLRSGFERVRREREIELEVAMAEEMMMDDESP